MNAPLQSGFIFAHIEIPRRVYFKTHRGGFRPDSHKALLAQLLPAVCRDASSLWSSAQLFLVSVFPKWLVVGSPLPVRESVSPAS